MATLAQRRAGATRFFWGWLIGSATVSVLGNVTHALLGDAPSPAIASVLAVVIVAIQLCATYGVHVLVHAHISGAPYHAALAIAIALAIGAFVLMFVALRDLVITWAGVPPLLAWIVPLIVDLGITGSTLAILALTNAQRTEQPAPVPATAHASAHPPAPVHVEVHNTVHAETHVDMHTIAADRIVADGVTRIDRGRVAEVLAAHATGMAPSMIARRQNVGYGTVKAILGHAAAQSTGRGAA